VIATDGLTSRGAETTEPRCANRHRRGRLWASNRTETSHLPNRRRERKRLDFKSRGSAQRGFATRAAVCNTCNVQRQLIRRPTIRRFRAEADARWAAAISAV
jgi:transposase-like protein